MVLASVEEAHRTKKPYYTLPYECGRGTPRLGALNDMAETYIRRHSVDFDVFDSFPPTYTNIQWK